MPKYRIPFYDTAIYYLEFESDAEWSEENPLAEGYDKLMDDAWANFNTPLSIDVQTAGDWSLSDDPWDIVKLD